MRYRQLSSDKDFVFGNGLLSYEINTPAAVGLAVESGLMLFLGEWFLDSSVGTPWIQGVLGKYSQDIADGTIKNQVLNTQGVVDISSYQSTINPNTRNMSVELTINTIYGPTQVQISNYRIF